MTALTSSSWKQIQVSYLLALDWFPSEATVSMVLKPYDKWLFLTGLSFLFDTEFDYPGAEIADRSIGMLWTLLMCVVGTPENFSGDTLLGSFMPIHVFSVHSFSYPLAGQIQQRLPKN